MTYEKLIDLLKAETHTRCKTFNDANITNFVASDLMSDVLTVDDENFLLITSLSSEQVARTADIVGARGILLVNGKTPQPRLIELCGEFNISLLTTPMRMFTSCHKLASELESEGISL